MALLQKDVDLDEERELRRLEGAPQLAAGAAAGGRAGPARVAAEAAVGGGVLGASGDGGGEEERGESEARAGEGAEEGAALVTGYAEHRASLVDKKKYRRAVN